MCEKFKLCDCLFHSNNIWHFVFSPKYCLQCVSIVELAIITRKSLLEIIINVCNTPVFFYSAKKKMKQNWRVLFLFAFSWIQAPAKFAKCIRLSHEVMACATMTACFSLSLSRSFRQMLWQCIFNRFWSREQDSIVENTSRFWNWVYFFFLDSQHLRLCCGFSSYKLIIGWT